MNKQEEINELKSKIKALETSIANCKHVWTEGKYDPEIVSEPYGHEFVGQGSDHYYRPTGFRDVSKPRWSRECTECGTKEYTYTEEVVNVEKKPKFNGR